ncbi:MAG: hypothetical protein AAGB05_02320 [Pseudomonadota bacterium]
MVHAILPRPERTRRRALGSSRLPILIALGLAVGARTLFPPAPDALEAVASPEHASEGLPYRARSAPEARPALPAGLALTVPPVSITPLPAVLKKEVGRP